MEVNCELVCEPKCGPVSQTSPEAVKYTEICESISQTLPERVNQIYNYIYIDMFFLSNRLG